MRFRARSSDERASLKPEELEALCHELRTPMNVVVGYLALLREQVYGELNDEQAEAVERIRFAAEHLVLALSHVFEIAELDLGDFQVTARSRRRGGHAFDARAPTKPESAKR